MGRLYQVASGGSTTRIGYDGLDRIAEYDAANAVQRRYLHGPGVDEPIVWYEGSETTTRKFLTADERGSVIAVTDSAGTVLGLNKYDEYGVPQATNLGKFGYTGQAWVPEVGLWYYKARFLRPDIGRFMQTDAVGYESGINLYIYALNDPVQYTDPDGNRPLRTGERQIADALFPGMIGNVNFLPSPSSSSFVFIKNTIWMNDYTSDYSALSLDNPAFNTFLQELQHIFEKSAGITSEGQLASEQLAAMLGVDVYS